MAVNVLRGHGDDEGNPVAVDLLLAPVRTRPLASRTPASFGYVTIIIIIIIVVVVIIIIIIIAIITAFARASVRPSCCVCRKLMLMAEFETEALLRGVKL